jgi:tetratricopeptide (TPR) repeat protein
LQRANQLFAAGDWRGVLSAYEALAKAFPNHALSRFRVGVAQLELGQFDAAESNLREGERLGVFPGMAAYRLAQLHAERGQEDKAIAELERAATLQFAATPSTLESDKHLASLKRHARWTAVLDLIDAVARPCMHDPRFREFDFWIGDWDVRPTGQPPSGPAARNTVTLEENGCVVMEHWNAPGGSHGQSFNIYDRSIGMWRQTWVDARRTSRDECWRRMDRPSADYTPSAKPPVLGAVESMVIAPWKEPSSVAVFSPAGWPGVLLREVRRSRFTATSSTSGG